MPDFLGHQAPSGTQVIRASFEFAIQIPHERQKLPEYRKPLAKLVMFRAEYPNLDAAIFCVVQRIFRVSRAVPTNARGVELIRI